MLRFLPLVLGFLAIGAVAVYDGLINYRWTPNRAAEAYAQLLADVPAEIGDWRGDDYEVNDEILRVAGAEGHISRAYVNKETNQHVKIWMIVGPFKHIIRHTPDICYPASDMPMQSEGQELFSFDVPGVENEFLTAIFGGRGQLERVFWAWLNPESTDGLAWQGLKLEDRRVRFAGTPALFKLYFTTSTNSEETPPESSAALDFAPEFLPVLTELIRQRGAAAE